MFRSASDMGRLYLTADLRPIEQSAPTAGAALFAAQFHRFPPIEDLVGALDRIASRSIAA